MRKRRNRGNWMPTLGHIESAGDQSFHYADQIIIGPGSALNVLPDGTLGGAQIGPTVLIPDFTPEESAINADLAASLHDRVSGNAWSLQRIVGKLHFQCVPSPADIANTAATWSAIFLNIGIFVARSTDANQGTADLGLTEADPTHVDNVMNPWIFKRSWILGNPLHQAISGFVPKWPQTTGGYAAANAAGHIDSKVKRFIPYEHRLFYVCNARGWNGSTLSVTGPQEDQPTFSGILDLRIYGSLRRSKPGSSF